MKSKDIHRPAIIKYYLNGNIKFSTWRNENGRLHRIDGPSRIHYYINGNIRSEEWFVNGIPHRTHGPSDIVYDINENIIEESWFYNNNNYKIEVNKWIDDNNFNSWEEMNENDFNRMWLEII